MGYHTRICASCGYRESTGNTLLHCYALFCQVCKADGDFEALMGRIEWSGQKQAPDGRIGLVKEGDLEGARAKQRKGDNSK